jgi:hypothetical protein
MKKLQKYTVCWVLLNSVYINKIKIKMKKKIKKNYLNVKMMNNMKVRLIIYGIFHKIGKKEEVEQFLKEIAC